MLLILLLLLFLYALVSFLWRRRRLLRQMPPKLPLGWPVFGDMALTRGDAHELIYREAKKLGQSVVTIEVRGTLAVVVCDAESARELFVRQSDAYADRPQFAAFAHALMKCKGLLIENGALFREQRRFALTTLRDLGFGKPLIEQSIRSEVETLLKTVEEARGQPIDMRMPLLATAGNVISRVVFGAEALGEDAEDFNDNISRISELSRTLAQTMALFMPNWLQTVLFTNPVGGALARRSQPLLGMQLRSVQRIVRRCRTPEADETPQTYVQAFVQKQVRGEGEFFTDEQLTHAASDLFGAGVDTTSTTLRWLLLHLLNHPDVQEKAFRQIKEVVGLDRLPELEHRARLPYVDALIAEAQRHNSLVPFANRCSSAESRVGEWRIPAGTLVLCNLWAVQRDPNVWEEPDHFRPERFLDAEGKFLKEKAELMMPFGLGKRKCLGESLARAELFLVAAALLQRFRFASPQGRPPPRAQDHHKCLVLSPFPFHLVAEKRYEV